jgi:hypothetical protein
LPFRKKGKNLHLSPREEVIFKNIENEHHQFIKQKNVGYDAIVLPPKADWSSSLSSGK